MPYYRNIHLLYLHIPKTGGTSIEDFLFEDNHIIKNISSLYSCGEAIKGIPYSLQHCTLNDIISFNKYLIVTRQITATNGCSCSLVIHPKGVC